LKTKQGGSNAPTIKETKNKNNMETIIKNNKQIIVQDYVFSGLGDYLDEQNIKWSHKSIEDVGDFAIIYLPIEWTSQNIWEFAMEFMKFRDRIS